MEKIVNDLSERTEVASNVVKFLQRSFSEIKHRQQNLDLARESVVERMMEIETLRESYEKGLKDLEEKELDFCAFKEREKRKLALEEDDLNLKREGVEKKMDELDSKGAELERKEDRLISKDIRLKEKLKELGLKEVSLRSWEKELKLKESDLRSWEKELKLKESDIRCWEKELRFRQREVDSVEKLNQRRSEELDRREKSLKSVRELTNSCFKEHIAIKKQLLLEKDLITRREKDLDLSDTVDLQFILRMDGKTLQMFLNDPEKDLESMGDEIFQVLHLSQDPAKLILDAMVGFYPPHLREDDVEVDVRKTCIILLEQLSKMTKRIQSSTREEAIELAGSWKSKMGASGEDPLEVLGFLHLLAAYNLTSYFDKDEILGFLKSTDQHRQSSLRFHVLGFEDSFADSTVEIGSQPESEEAKT